MQVFRSRRDPKYIKELKELLSVDGPQGVMARSVKTKDPVNRDEKLFNRVCKIDFAGIAATTLFDSSREFCTKSVTKSLHNLFSNAYRLNDCGIFIKMRLLLVYPYSDYALARIQAEVSQNRTSMTNRKVPINMTVNEPIDDDAFLQSRFVRSQSRMLERVQEFVEKYKWGPRTLNQVIVRFIPTSPNFCLLFVNDTVFLDPYLLAKTKSESRSLAFLTPLVYVNSREDRRTYDAIDDHFRYLWDLDLSMFCEDATEYKPGDPGSLGRIRRPEGISFRRKGERFQRKMIKNKLKCDDEDVRQWRFTLKHKLDLFCRTPALMPRSESLFITCSWKEEAGQSDPNHYAIELREVLERDFGRRGSSDPLLEISIMEGETGDSLSEKLYKELKESTLGLVLLTSDFKGEDGKLYSKPNVYHELGYLMRHLEGRPLAILCEKGTFIPTNIADDMRIDFDKDKLILSYCKIAEWIFNSCEIGYSERKIVYDNYEERLGRFQTFGRITIEEYHRALERMKSLCMQPEHCIL